MRVFTFSEPIDEIQMSDNALNSLKFFNENADEYHIIAAGSLLGLKFGKKIIPCRQSKFNGSVSLSINLDIFCDRTLCLSLGSMEFQSLLQPTVASSVQRPTIGVCPLISREKMMQS